MSRVRGATGLPELLPIGEWVQVVAYGWSLPPAPDSFDDPSLDEGVSNLWPGLYRVVYLALVDRHGQPRYFIQCVVIGIFNGPYLRLVYA